MVDDDLWLLCAVTLQPNTQDLMPHHGVGPQPQHKYTVLPEPLGYAMYNRPITTKEK